VCDGVRASNIEANVFHLRGARSHVVAETFPFRRRLVLFLVLSTPRPGRFPSYVRLIDDTDRAIFYGQVTPTPVFPNSEHLLSENLLPLELPIYVRFPKPGGYCTGMVLPGGLGGRLKNGTTAIRP
jgi:hypothetical protein